MRITKDIEKMMGERKAGNKALAGWLVKLFGLEAKLPASRLKIGDTAGYKPALRGRLL